MSVVAHYVKWRLGLAAAEGATTAAEADCLVRHACGKKRLAEIGVWQGGTTARLRAAMAPGATLFAVDPFPKGRLGFSTQRAIATREVAKIANGQVVWIRQTAADASRRHTSCAAPASPASIRKCRRWCGARRRSRRPPQAAG